MYDYTKEAYYSSLIKICKGDHTPAGVGVLVSEDTILTCAHVVANALELHADTTAEEIGKSASIWVHRAFVDGVIGTESNLVECKIEKYFSRAGTDEIKDLAILKTIKESRYSIHGNFGISYFSKEILKEGDNLRVLGFPLDALEKIGQTVEASYHITGSMYNQWLNALADNTYGDEIRAGFSGAPVMSAVSGDIIGIVCEADEDRRTATIIPVSLLSEITKLQFRPLKEVRLPYTEADSEQIIFFENNSSVFRIFLDWLSPSTHYFLTVKLGLLPDPPERILLEKRLREQQAEWSQELIGKTFLPPPAKEVPISPAQIISGNKKFYTPMQQLIKEVVGFSSGGDAASAQIAALSKKSKRVRSLVKHLKRSVTPIIVLGDPGAGKTITLKQVAIELSSLNSRRVFPSLCLFVPLGRWKPVKKPSIRDVEALVSETAGSDLAPMLLELSKRQRLIVIFDGLDEMSRLNYNEHTEALSKYADRYKGLIKTLFSCRIADFSPTFRHNRLVLLPFTRSHISNYLIRQFGKTKFKISGELISTKELGKRLTTQKLPIQPQNPFSLWLLSLYIRENLCWPDTRTELLAFLFDYQYERKLDEAKIADKTLPDKNQLFSDWGQLALLITERNHGTDVAIYEVRAIFGQRTDLLVEAGRVCGVLQRTLDHDPPLIRFEHHRAQEYFTAYGIVKSKVEIEWIKLLELPRWQETLVNVAQMDADSTPLCVLTKSLTVVGHDKNKDDPVFKALQESRHAEQVELGTRVLTAVPKSKEASGLEKEVVRSSVWLAENGNPTSKVKMLRLTNRLPAQGARDVVDKILDSKVVWVRTQALEIAASISSSISASPLPIEVANAYGDGSILRLIKSRLKIAYKAGSKGLAFVSLISLFLFIFHMFAISYIVKVSSIEFTEDVAYSNLFFDNLYSIKKQARKGKLSKDNALIKEQEFRKIQLLYKEWVSLLIPVAIALAIIGSLIWAPSYFWIIIPVSAGGVFLALSLIYSLWLYTPHAIIENIFEDVFTSIFMGAFWLGWYSFIWLLFAGSITFLLTSVLAISIYIWTRKRAHFFSSYDTIYQNSGFNEYVAVFAILWYISAALLGLGLAIQIVKWIFEWLASYAYLLVKPAISINEIVPDIIFLNRFFDYVLIGLLLLAVISLLWTFISVLSKGKTKKSIEYLQVPIATLGFSFIIFFIGKYLPLAGYQLTEKSTTEKTYSKITEKLLTENPYSITWIMEYAVFILIVIMVISIFIALVFMLYKIWRKYAPSIDIKHNQVNISKFGDIIKSENVDEQSRILRNLSLNELNLSLRDFYSSLIELEPYVTEEPALSRYYQKRIELEEILRQERQG